MGYPIPFIETVWPIERRFRTNSSVGAWIALLEETQDHFSVVYAAVKKFLVPIELENHGLYRFAREVGEDEPITVKHPQTTLDFLDTVIPKTLSRSSYELSNILTLMYEADPTLETDPRYLRLMDLVERS